jgi:hypothetical protein
MIQVWELKNCQSVCVHHPSPPQEEENLGFFEDTPSIDDVKQLHNKQMLLVPPQFRSLWVGFKSCVVFLWCFFFFFFPPITFFVIFHHKKKGNPLKFFVLSSLNLKKKFIKNQYIFFFVEIKYQFLK